MQWNLTTILIVFGVFLIGYTAGLIEMHIRRAKKIAQLQEALQADKAKLKTDSAPAIPQGVQKTLAREGDREILRAWRNDIGRVWLEMDATRFEGKETMSPEQRQRLVNTVLELRPWLDAPQVPTPRLQVQPLPPPPVPVSPSIISALTALADKPAEDEKVKAKLKSIVAQIDDVLQEKLSTTDFKNQEIHLLEGPSGEVFVQIRNTKFDGIDAVTDPEIKKLIRQAIVDWEKGSG